jgi:hypothetical protein
VSAFRLRSMRRGCGVPEHAHTSEGEEGDVSGDEGHAAHEHGARRREGVLSAGIYAQEATVLMKHRWVLKAVLAPHVDVV